MKNPATECIDLCLECHRIALQGFTYLLLARPGEPVRSVDPAVARLLLDASDVCRTAADFLVRGSELQRETCRACAAVCERCAEACDAAPEDFKLASCAAAARRCAASCREMSARA